MKSLPVTIETKSNLYIGGMPQGFEIGGIDMQTATQNNKPYIPASSFKGALREICSDHGCPDVAVLYEGYQAPASAKDATPKHLYIFGIVGVNRSPKLIFTDFTLNGSPKDAFSLDAKNSIDEESGSLIANPRTYRVARSGLRFTGNIILSFDMLGDRAKQAEEAVERYLRDMCDKFEEGVYRIGNSKSRGYGHITVALGERHA